MNYKEKLEEAKKLYKSANDDQKYVLESLFPELKESKDEKIRKKLLSAFKGIMDDADKDELWYGLTYNDILAWLEKQGKQNPCETCEEPRLNCQNFPCERKKIFDSSEKVKPKKFKVGDWVIGGIICNEARQIAKVEKDGYETTYPGWIGSAFEEDYRLWTIQDAKDGDVLVASDGSIFLFAGVIDCACKYYVALTADNNVKINKETKGGYWETSRAVHPATKKQRDLLFQKIKEAGYKWDADKKELKKIEQKSTWSEEDEKVLSKIIRRLYESNNISYSEYATFEVWLFDLKEKLINNCYVVSKK